MFSFSVCIRMERSPLDCPKCEKEFDTPVVLRCLHTFCEACSSNACSICPSVCNDPSPSPRSSSKNDRLAVFLLETSHEESEVCANCEMIMQPMFFCETCQQALCQDCRVSTHQAKMFAKHRVLRAEERARVRCSTVCQSHKEPFILYASTQKQLVCIQCFNDTPVDERHHLVSIETGHKNCIGKIEKWAGKLKLYQEEKREEMEVRRRVLADYENNFDSAKKGLFQLCQQIVDTVLSTRDRLSLRLEEDRKESEGACRLQIEQIEAIMDPIRLSLMASQILCASAAKLDVLQLSGELNERIQSILSRSVDKLPATRPFHPLESRSEIAKALEPYLGLSAAWCPISAVREGSREGSGSTHSLSHSYKARSGSQSMCMPPMLSKFQTIIDLSGTFGQLFGRVEGPLKEISSELGVLGQQVQEAQRDLTMRRCLVKSDIIQSLSKRCQLAESRLGLHASLIEEMQPELQQIWQEQLDRVRRQQIIFREKVDECSSLRGTARDVLTAARQLAPFAACIESMSALIDPRRCHPPDPAPMESICLQISTIEPDSEGRIAAIEKEEQNRKAVQEAKKLEELAERGTVVKGLKPGKGKRKDASRLLVNTARERSPGGTDVALMSPMIRRISSTVCEETASDLEAEEVWADELMFDNSATASWVDNNSLCTVDVAMMDEIRCSSSLSLSLPVGSAPTSPSPAQQPAPSARSSPCSSEVAILSGASVSLASQNQLQVMTSSSASLPPTSPPSPVVFPLPPATSLLDISSPTSALSSSPAADPSRIPLASRVTPDIGGSRQSMLQSLQDVFSLRERDNASVEGADSERNLLASSVKTSQRRKDDEAGSEVGESSDTSKRTIVDVVTLITPPSSDDSRKEPKRRRRKRVVDPVENDSKDTMVTSSTPDDASSEVPLSASSCDPSPVPLVPFVPSSLFDSIDTSPNSPKLGCFEAKEKVLQSLKEKVRNNRTGSNDSSSE